MRRIRLGAIAMVLLLLGVAQAATAAPASTPSTTPSKLTLFGSHISHLVVLVQENHAFDSLYGTYCPTTGTYCKNVAAGIPGGLCLPKSLINSAKGCVAPYNFSAQQLSPTLDLPHNWNSTHVAYNNGAMNGFLPAEYGSAETMGHYNGTTAPVYWDLAEQYGLGDEFFSPIASYSLPNHWYLLGSKAPNISYQTLITSKKSNWTVRTTYLDQANRTGSLEDELMNSSVSWKWYDYGLPSYSSAIQYKPLAQAYDYWDPLAGRAWSYTASVSSHFTSRPQFFSDAANGTLPNLSWVIPIGQNSDHPQFNLTSGQDWVADIVNALEQSPEWNSTVLFVTWDEYGGVYDHVAPPTLDGYGDGFRVPLLAIGPWIRQGYIDHTQMDFDSVLHLMEKRFGLACLGSRDCSAKMPLDLFAFGRGPRAPIQFLPYGQASYPMMLQSSGQLPYYGVRQGAAPVAYQDPASPSMDPNVDWS